MATAFKLALAQWPLLAVLWVSSGVSLLVFSGLLWRAGKLRASRHVFRRYWRRAILMGLMNPVLYYLVLFGAYDRLSAQVAQPINYTWAFVLSLLAAFWHKAPVRGQDWQGMIVGYLGVVVLVWGAASGDLEVTFLGVALGIASTLVWAGYWAVGMVDHRPALVAMWQHFAVAWPVLTLLMLINGFEFLQEPRGWAPAIYIGLFEMGLAFVFWMTGLQRVTNTARIANLIFIAPFLSLVWVSLFLDEPIALSTPLALVLILLGQWWQHRRTKSDHTPV